MLRIRLARIGRKKTPFFKIVLTEHTKPVKSWFMSILGWYNPLNHEASADIEKIKEHIWKWAQPSQRVAKILFKLSNDDFFKSYYKEINRNRTKKKQN